MSADQPLTGDELATIKTRLVNQRMRPTPETTLRLVAEIERLRAAVRLAAETLS